MPKKNALRKRMGSPSPGGGLARATSVGGDSVASFGGMDPDVGMDLLESIADPSSSLRPLLRGIVKIFCTFSEPSFAQPWTMKTQSKGTGSGFIVPGRKILTNAHVVAYQTSVQVRKHGDSQKYPGRILAVAHECDIAILTVDDPEFWSGAIELDFAPMPRLQQEVFVVGYPVGGETISITGGVVSRVDFDSYAHSTRDHLVCSVDAAINPGNSGGPAISRGRVVGIAFQSLVGAEATGYIIPTPVVQHVLEDLGKHGKLTGFARLGFIYQTLESPHLKSFLKLPKGVTGILINKTLPLSNLHGVLEKNDIVAAIEGKKIADDGTVVLRDEDRIAVGYLLTNKFIGDPIELTIYRQGEKKIIKSTVEDVPDLVPTTLYERKPQYLVHAGLVFTAATDPFLESAFGGLLDSTASLRLIQLSTEGEMQERGEQVVVLANLLSHTVNVGYEDEDYVGLALKKVNDVKIKNMVETAKAIKEATGPWIIFEFEGSMTIVLPLDASIKATAEILRQQAIPAPMSADLLEALGEAVPASMAPAEAIYAPTVAVTPAAAALFTPSSEVPSPAHGFGSPEGAGPREEGSHSKRHPNNKHRTNSVSSVEA